MELIVVGRSIAPQRPITLKSSDEDCFPACMLKYERDAVV